MKQNNFRPNKHYLQIKRTDLLLLLSSLSTKEIQERVNKLQMMGPLLEDPAKVSTTFQFQNFRGTKVPIEWYYLTFEQLIRFLLL